MRILSLTPGKGNYYSGAALRDHCLINALRRTGHEGQLVALGQPPLLEYDDEGADTPLFYDILHVYRTEQKGLFGKLKTIYTKPSGAARAIERMTPTAYGQLLLSRLQAADGRQRKALQKLTDWLKSQAPDVILVSDATWVGVGAHLKEALGVPVIVSLQGENRVLNSLPNKVRDEVLQCARPAAAKVDAFIAPSRYHAAGMKERLQLDDERVALIPNGIALNEYSVAAAPPSRPALGFLGRLCDENGLENVIKAYKSLYKNGHDDLQLRLAGALSRENLTYIAKLLRPLQQKYGKSIGILRNVPLERKITFLQGLSVMCTPSPDEAFGRFAIEAMAVGTPVVLPDRGAFPELIETTGGGLLAESDEPKALARTINKLLKDADKREVLGKAGREAVLQHYSVEKMAGRVMELIEAQPGANGVPADLRADNADTPAPGPAEG